jgi:hypothetical protein
VYRLLSNDPLLAKYYPVFNEKYYKIPGVPAKDYENKYIVTVAMDVYSPLTTGDTMFTMDIYKVAQSAGDKSDDELDELVDKIKIFIRNNLQLQLGKQINSNPRVSQLHIYSIDSVNPKQCSRLPFISSDRLGSTSKCPTKEFILIDLIDTQMHPHVCAVCGKSAISLCAGCKKVAYCGPKCQKADWSTHKSICKNPAISISGSAAAAAVASAASRSGSAAASAASGSAASAASRSAASAASRSAAKGGRRKTSKRRAIAKRRKTRYSSA